MSMKGLSDRVRRQAGSSQRGFSMVEVLVALVVLTIGLLGIAALYLDSLRAGRTAIYRAQAVNLGADLADRIRTNRLGLVSYAAAYGDAVIAVPSCDTQAGCTAAELAATDLSRWKLAIATLLPGGQGQVAVTPPAVAGAPALYVLTIRWTEVGQDVPATFSLRFNS